MTRILQKAIMEERNATIERLRDQGLKFKQIAPQVRLGVEATQLIYYKRKKEHETVNK